MGTSKDEYERSVAYARTFCPPSLVDVLDWNVENEQTFHDSSILEFHAYRQDVYSDRNVKLTILNPQWDRKYVVEFTGVHDFKFENLHIPPGQCVSCLIFEPSTENRRCRIYFLGTRDFAELEFSGIAFETIILAQPMTRKSKK